MPQSTTSFNDKSRVITVGSSDVLLKFRLWFYSLAFAHLAIMAVKLLGIDFREADDPNVWVYQEFKWKLITCWFNLITLAYLPICIYCDWRELRREHGQHHVKVLNQIKLICFTSILLPTTTFADTFFWRLWIKDRELVAPKSVDKIVPFWTQHCMHTVSLIVVLADLIIVPRQRPKSLLPGFIVMGLFIGTYSCVCIHSLYQGEYIYPILKLLNTTKLFFMTMLVIFEHILYYFGQWFVIDLIWGEQNQVIKNKSIKKNSNEWSWISDLGSFLVDTVCKVIPILGLSKSATN